MKYNEIIEYLKNKLPDEKNKKIMDNEVKNINDLILAYYHIENNGLLVEEEKEKLKKAIIELDPYNLKVSEEEIKDKNIDYDDYLYFKKAELQNQSIHNHAQKRYDELSKKGKFIFVDAKPDEGFNFGFMVYIPNNVEENTSLMMHCCNTPTGLGMKSVKEANDFAIDCNINDEFLYNISLNSNIPFFMPIIPRVNGFNTQLHNEFVEYGDKKHFDKLQEALPKKYRLSEEEKIKLIKDSKNLDDQIEIMTIHAKDVLKSYNINTNEKIIVEGFSAGSIFATKFTNNKSDLVGATIIGGNSGIYDVQNEDIIKFYYNGGKDTNNPSDKKYDDTFSEELKDKLFEEYKKSGSNDNQNVYQINKQKEQLENSKNTTYNLYKNEGHKTVCKAASSDVINFIKKTNLELRKKELLEKQKNKTLSYNFGITNVLYISIILIVMTLIYIILK